MTMFWDSWLSYTARSKSEQFGKYMVDKLWEVGFQQSQIDKCFFYRDDVIFIMYIDDGLLFSTNDDTLTWIMKQLKDSGLNTKEQGHQADYVGVNIKKTHDGSYKFTHAL
jgi:hypothetical protein